MSENVIDCVGESCFSVVCGYDDRYGVEWYGDFFFVVF